MENMLEIWLAPGANTVIIKMFRIGEIDTIRCFPMAWRKWSMFVPARSLCCLLAVTLAAVLPPVSAPEPLVVRGEFLTLMEALAARDLKLKPDPEPIARQVVLLAEDGTIFPLLSDDSSRALFLDERLRHCKGEVQGRRFAGVPYLQVVSFKVEREGRLQRPEYYCDVCAISVLYPQICPCCQGPMELRMKPEPN